MLNKYSLAVLFVFINLSIGLTEPFEFSFSEQAWLSAHNEIRVGLVENNPPQSMVHERGTASGIGPEVVELLNRKLSGRLTIITGSWQKIYQDALEKRVDILLSLTPSKKRREYFNFTRPYMSSPHVIVAKEEGQHFGDLASLSGYTIGLEHSSFLVSYIRTHYPDITIREYGNALEIFKAIHQEEVDAYIGSIIATEYLLSTNSIQDLDFHGRSNETSETHMIAVRKDWPVLASILDRLLISIPHKEFYAVTEHLGKSRAFEGIASEDFQLTPEEEIWLKSLGTLSIGLSATWAPIKFTGSDGNHQGISSEYTRIIQDKLGLDLRLVVDSWEKIQNRARAGTIDILPILNETENRREYLTFTKPFVKIPIIIATRTDSPYFAYINDLAGLMVGVGEGFAVQTKLNRDYPEIKTMGYTTIEEAVKALDSGKISALIANSAVFSYHQNKLGLQGSIHINNTAPYEDKLAFGISHKLAPLAPLINRVFSGISKEEHELINDKWVNLPFLKQTDWSVVWQIIGISIIILLLILFWSSKMALEVKWRRKAEANLVQSDERFHSVFSKISDLVMVWDTSHRFIYANQSALDYIAMKKEVVYKHRIFDLFSSKNPIANLWQKRIIDAFIDGKTHHYEDQITLDGQEIFSESTLAPLFTDSGHIYAVSLVYRDVTARKKTEIELKGFADTQAILLREVNHRVKNNLSAIISILHMEGDKAETLYCSQFCSQPLKAIESRISSLLIVHTMLSISKWQPILLTEMCEKVIRESIIGFTDRDTFKLDISDCDLLVNSDMAHSLALVLSELAVNSSKYAFQDTGKETITVSINLNIDMIELSYKDNGPGFPEHVLMGEQSDGHIGMEIMEGIVTGNMGGAIKHKNDKGACTRITFQA